MADDRMRPTEEMVTVVDADNRVTGAAPRSEMRSRKLPHRATYVLCRNSAGRYLVEVRTRSKDYAPGLLDACVGGVVAADEEPDDSARRELMEEVGLDCARPGARLIPLGARKVMYQDGVHFLYAHMYLLCSDQITRRQREEVSGVMYLDAAEMRKLESCFTFDSFQVFETIEQLARERGLVPA